MAITTTAAAKLPPLKPGEFRFVTKALSVTSEGEGDNRVRRFHTIASSTLKDLGNDEMKLSALEDMAASFRRGLTIFMNHSYKVPEDVFGRSDSAEIRESGLRDEKTGTPIWDLHIGGIVNVPNDRARSLADSMEGGYVTFGTSVGAIVKAHQRNKDGGMDIEHVDCKEGSIVGIPMNQRSWTQKSAKAAQALEDAGSGLADEDEEDEAPEAVVEAEKALPADGIAKEGIEAPLGETVELVVDDPSLPEAPEIEKADLSGKARGKLPDSAFACPEKRKYPIHDKAHVRAALSRVADPSNDQCGKEKILAAARRMGIGEHDQKAFTDEDLIVWAINNLDPEVEKAATTCPQCGGSADEPNGDCGNPMHSMSDTDNDGDDPASGYDPDHDGKSAETVLDAAAITKGTTEGGQEADPAATPETAPAAENGSDPATVQKAIEFEATDVVALVKHVETLVTKVGQLTDENVALKAERDRLASENEDAKAVIARVMKQPLRPQAQGHLADLTKRLPDFLAPEVRDYIQKAAAGEANER